MPHNVTAKDEALSALVMLGFTKNVAEKALDAAAKSEGEGLTVERLIKIALKSL
jgi:Holliday junction DNA helicase RuvA